MSRPPTASSSSSSSSASSYDSMLSDDSYLEKLLPIDQGFQEMMADIKVLENKRRIFEERKVQSHIQKGRDSNDTARREDWTDKQIKDYNNYKGLVKTLSDANAKAEASRKAARQKKDEKSRLQALHDQQHKCTLAVLAAEARLGFMTRYPNAFSTPSHASHIKAVEDNLNASKVAKREMDTQLEKIAAAKELEKRKAAAAAAKKKAAEDAANKSAGDNNGKK